MKGHRHPETGLTADEERFCLELVKPGMSQADAYRRAFPRSRKWKDESVQVKASKLAATDKVRLRAKELLAEVTAAGIIDATETKLLLSRVARADLRKCYRADGTLKAPHEIDDETAAGILGFETTEESKGKGKARRRVVLARKVRFANRVDALSLLMRHFGLFEKDNAQKVDMIREFLEAVSGKSRGLPKPL